MPRTFYINGESMITIGPMGSLTPLVQLGLTEDRVEVSLRVHSEPLYVDAFGKLNPANEQVFGGEAIITMHLIHFDPVQLAVCAKSAFNGPKEGYLGRAGLTRDATGGGFISLGIASPIAGLPFIFPTAYLRDDPYRMPLGNEKTVATLIWRALAYPIGGDPWGGGTGSLGAILYSRGC